MERLEYKIEISAPAKKVWNTMLEKETYEQWVANSWPGSTYQGKWGKGERISFTDKSGSGTLAVQDEYKPFEYVLARHIAVLDKGKEVTTGDMANSWLGTTEAYRLDEHNGKTTLTVVIETTPGWKQMFNDGWPTALKDLKKIAERQQVEA